MKGWRKTGVLLLIAVMLAGISGCSSVTGGSTASLDIDYVNADGEITEEEVAAESGSLMNWLKGKLSSDKSSAKRVTGGETTETVVAEESGLREAFSQIEETSGGAVTQQEEGSQEGETADQGVVQTSKDQEGTEEQPSSDSEETKKSDTEKTNTVKGNTCTITIRCDTAVAQGMHLESKWAGIVPASGCILPVTTVEFEEGDTVFDVVCYIRDTYKLQMEYNGSNGGEYIEGINNLYEFDGGRWSGWMYCVNGWYPNYGCGQYTVKKGDVIEWNYTCDLGLDLDSTWWEGAQDWKDTHE